MKIPNNVDELTRLIVEAVAECKENPHCALVPDLRFHIADGLCTIMHSMSELKNDIEVSGAVEPSSSNRHSDYLKNMVLCATAQAILSGDFGHQGKALSIDYISQHLDSLNSYGFMTRLEAVLTQWQGSVAPLEDQYAQFKGSCTLIDAQLCLIDDLANILHMYCADVYENFPAIVVPPKLSSLQAEGFININQYRMDTFQEVGNLLMGLFLVLKKIEIINRGMK